MGEYTWVKIETESRLLSSNMAQQNGIRCALGLLVGGGAQYKCLSYSYISHGFRYLVEIWFAQSAVIIPESGDSIAAILIIDMTTWLGWSCLVWVKFDTPTQQGALTRSSYKLLGQSQRTNV